MALEATAKTAITHALEPLCDATAELLKPLDLYPNDYLEVSLAHKDPDHFVFQTYALNNGNRVAASYNASVRFFDRLQELKEIGSGRYLVGATDFNVLIANAVWQNDHISFKDGQARTVWTYLLLRFMEQTRVAMRNAHFKIEGIVPEPPENWVDHPQYPLAGFQRVAAYSGIESEGFAYFMEQGTGKTPTAISVLMHDAAKKYRETGKMHRTIITCPKNVKFNWSRELKKFCTIPGKIVVLRGGQLNRVKQLVEVAESEPGCQFCVAITSYEGVQRTWDALQLFPWDLGIADESHMFKSPWAKRAAYMVKLRDICEKRLALTGTPIGNTLLDLYFQLEWLGPGMSGFVDWKQFRSYYNQYASPDEVSNYQGAKVLIGFKNLPMLHERLARVSFRITKKEAMPELPEKLPPDVIECTMAPDQKKVYASLASQLAAELSESLDDSNRMSVNNALTKLLRLSQVTAGFATADAEYDDEGNPKVVGDARLKWFKTNPKLDTLVEVLKEKTPDEKTIVWCCWIPAIKAIHARLTAEGIKCVMYHGGVSEADREIAEHSFNRDPEVKVFIGNPAAGGVGMNLPGYDAENPDAYTTNADHTIYYACNWSFLQRSQSEDRNHGRGRCRVTIRQSDLIVPGTIDQEIMETLTDKKVTALEAQDVRFIMERLIAFDSSASDD